jgi:hypothetical protein
MLLATFIGTLFIPPMFVVAERMTERLGRKKKKVVTRESPEPVKAEPVGE